MPWYKKLWPHIKFLSRVAIFGGKETIKYYYGVDIDKVIEQAKRGKLEK